MKQNQQPTDILTTLAFETALGTLTVSDEDIQRHGGVDKWRQDNGYTAENEDEAPCLGPGPTMTRAEYDALPELD